MKLLPAKILCAADKARARVSKYTKAKRKALERKARARIKNGILVHHAGKPITADDVRKAQDENA